MDGGLTAGERSRVERHLAACRDCFAVFAESVKTVQALADAGRVRGAPGRRYRASRRRLTRRLGGGGGAGLAAAAALAVAVWWPRARAAELVDLVAAVGERRPVEGRLTGGFRFGPIESPMRGAEAGTDWRVLAAADKLERGSAEAQRTRVSWARSAPRIW